MWWRWIILLPFNLIVCYQQCDHLSGRMLKPPNPNQVFILEISGNPANYVPGETYTVTIKNNPKMYLNSRFRDFEIVAEPSNLDPLQFFNPPSVGNFRLLDPMLTSISSKCRNTVIQTNTVLKPSVQVSWIAPPPNSGCLFIKATVAENEENWYAPIGNLTRFLCEEASQNADTQNPAIEECCACDEAKYEIAFHGIWSRNTHPKDYPTDIWTTKFSDIIGASHQFNKSFWNYGDFASAGLKLLAEDGDTSLLETELKEMNDNIRTIIKARELSYPNITGTSYTVFRVDKENHLMSLVSKITPSPDWIVGVANLELCTTNCTWIEAVELNLYPWDVGTDDGVTYTSTKSPAFKPEMIKMIKSNSPNDPRAPFFSDNGEPLKPLARLQVTREKIYEKDCNNDGDIIDKNNRNCATTVWSKWSQCSSDCFKVRTREYKHPELAEKCRKHIKEKRPCKPHQCNKNEALDENDQRCEVTEWSQWSNCTVKCGKGIRTRDRSFKNQISDSICTVQLQENEECGEVCDNNEDAASGEDAGNQNDCPNVFWEEWSPCSVTCGNGIKTRYRVTANEDDEDPPPEDGPCANLQLQETVECYNPPCDGDNPFNTINTENQVVTSTDYEIVDQQPTGIVIDCVVTNWTIWSPCNTTEPCKKGYRFQFRQIKTHAMNGGRPCPKKLLRKRRCTVPCNKRPRTTTMEPVVSSNEIDEIETRPTWGNPQLSKRNNNEPIDCVMGEWSAWSPCTNSCGSQAVQIKTRLIRVHPMNGGKECGPRKLERKCPLPLACTGSGRLPIF